MSEARQDLVKENERLRREIERLRAQTAARVEHLERQNAYRSVPPAAR